MLVFPAKKIVLITPPRTGSMALAQMLTKNNEAHIVLGPQLGLDPKHPDYIGAHTICIPHEYRRYKKVLAIRNPLERAISSWLYHCKWELFKGPHAPSWEEFFYDLVNGFMGSFHTWTLCKFTEVEGGIDKVIQLENWPQDIKKILGIEGASNWPKVNSIMGEGRPKLSFFFQNKEIREKAFKYWQNDIMYWYDTPLKLLKL